MMIFSPLLFLMNIAFTGEIVKVSKGEAIQP